MGRPTDEVKSHIVKCRIGDTLYNKISGENISEVVRNALESFVTHKNASVPQKESNVPQKESNVPQYKQQSSTLPLETEIELRDTLRMVELSSSEDEVPLFLKDLHDRLESGEFQIENGRLKLGYSEVFKVLNMAEVKKWLKPVWNACDEKGKTYTDGLRAVFKHGAKYATEDIYGDRQ